MDVELRIKALRNLALSAGDATQLSLDKAASKISDSLSNETQYDLIAEDLKLLDAIAFRVSKKAFETVSDLLDRLATLELTYEEIQGFPVERLKKYQNNEALIVKALDVLSNIRYHQPEGILNVFFNYSCHKNEEVAKQAVEGLKAYAGFDLDIYYSDGKDWHGLGSEPQEKALEKIVALTDDELMHYFDAILVVAGELLSPTISGESSTYNKFTIKNREYTG